MLGDVLVDERGQVTGTRVLPSEDGRPTIEVSFQATGQLLGTDATDMGTFVSAVREDGTLFGDGQGVAMTADGGVATWKGQGVGRFTGRGSAVSWRGAIYWQSTSNGLTRLNEVAGVFEFDVDENGKTDAKTWEWK